jgi:hypothetical protein
MRSQSRGGSRRTLLHSGNTVALCATALPLPGLAILVFSGGVWPASTCHDFWFGGCGFEPSKDGLASKQDALLCHAIQHWKCR